MMIDLCPPFPHANPCSIQYQVFVLGRLGAVSGGRKDEKRPLNILEGKRNNITDLYKLKNDDRIKRVVFFFH